MIEPPNITEELLSTLKPLRNEVLIELDPHPGIGYKTTLIIPDARARKVRSQGQRGTVYANGPQCDGRCAKGDDVIFWGSAPKFLSCGSRQFAIIPEGELVGVVPPAAPSYAEIHTDLTAETERLLGRPLGKVGKEYFKTLAAEAEKPLEEPPPKSTYSWVDHFEDMARKVKEREG